MTAPDQDAAAFSEPAAPPVLGAESDATRPLLPPELVPAILTAASGALLIVGSFLRWAVVHFDGVLIRQLSASGWDRGDGKITVLIGVGAAIVAGLLARGRTDRWLSIGLAIGALVGLLDVGLDLLQVTGADAAGDIAEDLGLQAEGIESGFGYGALVAGAGALGLAGAALLLERPRP